MRTLVAVAGAGAGGADARLLAMAEEVGALLAIRGVGVVCGGLGGVMEAACRGAEREGGLTIGLLPGTDRTAANPFVEIAVPTGLGEARNVLVVRAGVAVIAVGGQYGTLSEIALALKIGTPVIGLATWRIPRPPAGTDAPAITRDAAAITRDKPAHEQTDEAFPTAADPPEAVRLALGGQETV